MTFTIRKESSRSRRCPRRAARRCSTGCGRHFHRRSPHRHALHRTDNANGILHVANMVANIGRLESAGNGYRFYAEGYTPSAIRVLESVSDERLAVARAFGVALPGIHQWLLDTYRLGGDTLAETFTGLPTRRPARISGRRRPRRWNTSTSPRTSRADSSRWRASATRRASHAGHRRPHRPRSSMLGRDLAATEGRTLDYLGLTGKSVGEIKQIFEVGP